MHRLVRAISPWALAVYWITLFVMTHTPVPAGPPGSDKLFHFGAYFVLAALFALVLLSRGYTPRRTALLTIPVLCGFAVFDEVTQMLVDRHCDVLDGLADWAGVAVGTVSVIGARRWLPVDQSPADEQRQDRTTEPL